MTVPTPQRGSHETIHLSAQRGSRVAVVSTVEFLTPLESSLGKVFPVLTKRPAQDVDLDFHPHNLVPPRQGLW